MDERPSFGGVHQGGRGSFEILEKSRELQSGMFEPMFVPDLCCVFVVGNEFFNDNLCLYKLRHADANVVHELHHHFIQREVFFLSFVSFKTSFLMLTENKVNYLCFFS